MEMQLGYPRYAHDGCTHYEQCYAASNLAAEKKVKYTLW